VRTFDPTLLRVQDVSDGATSSHSGADYLIPNFSLHLASVEWGRTIRPSPPASFDELIEPGLN